MFEWISTKDFLPSNWDLYLCYCLTPWLVGGKSRFMLLEWANDKDEWYLGDKCMEDATVAYWMPLTHPSKKEEDEYDN